MRRPVASEILLDKTRIIACKTELAYIHSAHSRSQEVEKYFREALPDNREVTHPRASHQLLWFSLNYALHLYIVANKLSESKMMVEITLKIHQLLDIVHLDNYTSIWILACYAEHENFGLAKQYFQLA